MCMFQSESTHYSVLNVKELLARNRHKILSLSDCNGTRTRNQLVRKRTLNHLANGSDFAPVSSKELLDIQATVECGFTLKRVCDIIKTYSQMRSTDKYSQHSSIIWPVWLNGCVFVYELSGSGFESRCSHLYPIFLKK